MRRLTPAEMNIPAGGSTPRLFCNTTNSSNSVSGNTTTSHSTEICQTSSGLTVITTRDTITVTGEAGITGKFKEILGIESKVGFEKTTTDTTVCKPNGDCTSTKETTTNPKSSDASDGSAVDSVADSGGEGSGDGGAWAGGDCGDIGGDIFEDAFEFETC